MTDDGTVRIGHR